MLYLIHKSMIHELSARREFLYKAFKLYFILTKENKRFLTLQSFPLITDDIVFITGHKQFVHGFMDSNPDCIKDSNLVLTTCFPREFRKFASKCKAMYFARTNEDGEAETYEGADFGTGFNITLSELDLLISNEHDPIEKIKQAYKKIPAQSKGGK